MNKKSQTATPPTAAQVQEWRVKAEKWDKLDKIIAKFYPDESEDPSEGGDLGDIGEAAAIAFGYL